MKDFRNQNLKGRSFRNQDLTGADFSGADIHGTDFRGANLTKANFCKARMGKTLNRNIALFLFLINIGSVAGALNLFGNVLLITIFESTAKGFFSLPEIFLFILQVWCICWGWP
jgi:uncharacterized protein YjbI with pentapeptide repeats